MRRLVRNILHPCSLQFWRWSPLVRFVCCADCFDFHEFFKHKEDELIVRKVFSAILMFVSLGVSGGETATNGGAANGIALMYRVNLPPVYAMRASVFMPESTQNADFSAAWLMLISASDDGSSLGQPFIQAGLIRDQRKAKRLQAFTTFQKTPEAMTYEGLEFLNERAHIIELDKSTTAATFYVDGKLVRKDILADIFPKGRRLYVQIGSELRQPGDSIRVEWSSLQERIDGKWRAFRPSCFRDDRGLIVDADAEGRLAVSGIFDTSRPSQFKGYCAAP